MPGALHVYACLVHERPSCVVDLVRNLRCLDPDSLVLLYNGGRDTALLRNAKLDGLGVTLHPSPRPQRWGRLHGFAIDCLRYALELPEFAALTVVDSDQLCVRRNYGAALLEHLATRPQAGLLSGSPERITREVAQSNASALSAWNERARFENVLARHPNAQHAWLHWSFWPATVISRAAAEKLVPLFEDPQVQNAIEGSKLQGTEETLLPTFTELVGLCIEQNPFHNRFLGHRVQHNTASADVAVLSKDVAWMHPVPRRYDDPLRAHIRMRFAQYAPVPLPPLAAEPDPLWQRLRARLPF